MDYLRIGPVQALVQNTIVALPAVHTKLYTDGGITLLQSSDAAFTANTAVTLVEGSYELSAGFAKMTSAGPKNVFLRRA